MCHWWDSLDYYGTILIEGTTMSTIALILMLVTWAYILFFTIKFLIKVIKTPMKKDDSDDVEMESSSNSPDPRVNNDQ